MPDAPAATTPSPPAATAWPDVKPPPAHPLCGADVATLWRVSRSLGGASRGRRAALALAWAAAVGRLPSTLAESLCTRRLVRRAEPPPALFILGHWRSGTTHLYNVLAKASRFAYLPPVATGLPWDALGLARLLRRPLEATLPKERWIDPVPVLPDSPQEDEIALANMDPLSFYHGIYFPKHLQGMIDRGVFLEGVSEAELARWNRLFLHLHAKVMRLHPAADTLLIKNPVYTARVAMLTEMLPAAKFVHLHRHPYEVFRSMRNFWRKLLPALALQDYRHVDVDELVLATYDRMMRRLDEQRHAVSTGAFVELGYDELDADPLAAIERVYAAVGLDGFADDRPRFERYLASIESYRKQRYELDDATRRRIDARWGRWFERFGYAPR